jgi:hypothetical protein
MSRVTGVTIDIDLMLNQTGIPNISMPLGDRVVNLKEKAFVSC